MTPTNPTRPICPDCGLEMVYLATSMGPEVLLCWVCSCKNPHLAVDIEEARADASQEASLCVTYEAYTEEDALPQLPAGQEHRLLQFYCPN